jgi:hypothetical protein
MRQVRDAARRLRREGTFQRHTKQFCRDCASYRNRKLKMQKLVGDEGGLPAVSQKLDRAASIVKSVVKGGTAANVAYEMLAQHLLFQGEWWGLFRVEAETGNEPPSVTDEDARRIRDAAKGGEAPGSTATQANVTAMPKQEPAQVDWKRLGDDTVATVRELGGRNISFSSIYNWLAESWPNLRVEHLDYMLDDLLKRKKLVKANTLRTCLVVAARRRAPGHGNGCGTLSAIGAASGKRNGHADPSAGIGAPAAIGAGGAKAKEAEGCCLRCPPGHAGGKSVVQGHREGGARGTGLEPGAGQQPHAGHAGQAPRLPGSW